MAHKISNVGIGLIKEHEGLRLRAYLDPVGVWTIGWGHTKSVTPGQFISYEQATTLLLEDVQEAEKCVNSHVKVPIYQSMFDALVSFVFNLGCGAFRTSTLLSRLNDGSYIAAADQFPRWNRGGGRVLPGLIRRRALEQGLFLTQMRLVHNFPMEELNEKPIEDYPSAPYTSPLRHPYWSGLPEEQPLFASHHIGEFGSCYSYDAGTTRVGREAESRHASNY